MKKKTYDPLTNLILDEEEKLLEEAFERGEYEEADDFEQTKEMLADAAKRYKQLNISKPVTFRVNQLDLIKLKAKAKKRNIPYQTLLSALVNDYVEGRKQLSL